LKFFESIPVFFPAKIKTIRKCTFKKKEELDPPNWSGIRASIGIRVSFDKKVPQSEKE